MGQVNGVVLLGLGRMGSAMAERYADIGWSVTSWSRSGGGSVATAAEAVRGVDAVVLALYDGDACRSRARRGGRRARRRTAGGQHEHDRPGRGDPAVRPGRRGGRPLRARADPRLCPRRARRFAARARGRPSRRRRSGSAGACSDRRRGASRRRCTRRGRRQAGRQRIAGRRGPRPARRPRGCCPAGPAAAGRARHPGARPTGRPGARLSSASRIRRRRRGLLHGRRDCQGRLAPRACDRVRWTRRTPAGPARQRTGRAGRRLHGAGAAVGVPRSSRPDEPRRRPRAAARLRARSRHGRPDVLPPSVPSDRAHRGVARRRVRLVGPRHLLRTLRRLARGRRGRQDPHGRPGPPDRHRRDGDHDAAARRRDVHRHVRAAAAGREGGGSPTRSTTATATAERTDPFPRHHVRRHSGPRPSHPRSPP